MSHNPGYIAPNVWTDKGGLSAPESLHERIVAVLHDVDGLQVRNEELHRKNNELRAALNITVGYLDAIASTHSLIEREKLVEELIAKLPKLI